jgi:hypothetical protein
MAVDEIDADFQDLTVEDGRYRTQFASLAGPGWWWERLPADREALKYILQDREALNYILQD